MSESNLTIQEFVEQYAAGSKLSFQELDDLGLYPVPCDCGDWDCNGWQMATNNTPDVSELDKETGIVLMLKLARGKEAAG